MFLEIMLATVLTRVSDVETSSLIPVIIVPLSTDCTVGNIRIVSGQHPRQDCSIVDNSFS